MDPVEAMVRLGGIASARQLLALTGRARLRRAVAEGAIRRAGRDRYVLPASGQARRAATLANGVLILLSAALEHGWEVRLPPERPQIGVPRGRPLTALQSAEVRRIDVPHEGWATTPLSTVLMCADELPFTDALAAADSALRHSDVTREGLLERARGPRQNLVALHADARAANPFESALRAILVEEGWPVVPQLELCARGLTLHPDLVDPFGGYVFEAESWEFHAKDRASFERDCERYTALVIEGWQVLRFTWAEVIHRPDSVRACLRELRARVA